MSQGFARNGWPRGHKIIFPSDFVAHATPHTKGSWVQIDASTAQDMVGMWVYAELTIGVSATDTSMLMDIGIGGAGSEVVVVSNIPVGGHVGNATLGSVPFFLPLHVPAGSRLAGRIQGAVTVDVYDPVIQLVFGGRPGSWGGYSIAETIGVDTATSGPTTGDLTDNAWDEAVASTANTYRALTLHMCLPTGSTSVTLSSMVEIDVGVGAAGSEQILGTWRCSAGSNEILLRVIGPDFIERNVPAGSRLAIRKNGTADLSGALIGWR